MNATKVIVLTFAAIALLFCPVEADAFLKKAAQSNLRVALATKPFGVKVLAHPFLHVSGVAAGSAAEAAGVKTGFVLTAIGDQQVDAQDWFEIMQKAPLGTVLTFDTSGNKGAVEALADASFVVPAALDKGFIDFHCAVKSQAFGLEVSNSREGHATVHAVTAGTPAEAAGVKVGDVVVAVAGKKVDMLSWRAAFDQSTLPFSLRFRRPAALNVPNPKKMTGKSD